MGAENVDKPRKLDKIGDSDDYRQVTRLLRWLRSRDFFGKVTLSFERGKIVHVKKEDNLSLRQRDIDRMTGDL